jgi:ATP-dependent DNA ligase
LLKTWPFESSSSDKVYHTTLLEDLTLRCDCPGYYIKKKGKPWECKHITKKVIPAEGFKVRYNAEERVVVENYKGAFTLDQAVKRSGNNPEVAAMAKSVMTNLGPGVTGVTFASEAPEPPKPARVNPMLASAMPDGRSISDYEDPGFAMEEKLDGHRVMVRVKDGVVEAWSRPRAGGNGPLTRSLPPHIIEQLLKLVDALIDGELVSPSGQSWNVVELCNAHKLKLVLFDLLEAHGKNFMGQPYSTRRQALELVVGRMKPDPNVVSIVESGPVSEAAVKAIWDRGGEGGVIKRKAGIYRPGWRTPDWIKVKKQNTAVLTITGFKAGKNGPYSTVLLKDDNGIETRVKTLDNDWLREFDKNAASYIGKRLVIHYQEQTPSGSYRHGMWDHIAGEGEK